MLTTPTKYSGNAPSQALRVALAERCVPFLLISGYGDALLPMQVKHWPVRDKPSTRMTCSPAWAGMVGKADQ